PDAAPRRRAEGARPPRRLAWLAAQLNPLGMHMTDLCLPRFTKLKGKVLVTVEFLKVPGAKPKPMELWWLELDARGTAIVRAGRLRRTSVGRAERLAQVAEADDGGNILAYLATEAGETAWQLRVAALEIDAQTGGLQLMPETEQTIVNGCVPVAPVFSSN